MTYAQYYDLPEEFYRQIEPYIHGNAKRAMTRREIVAIWRCAVKVRDAHPDKQEQIAEWSVSACASSPLVMDNDKYEAIHCAFGYLEFSNENSDEEWRKLKHAIDDIDT